MSINFHILVYPYVMNIQGNGGTHTSVNLQYGEHGSGDHVEVYLDLSITFGKIFLRFLLVPTFTTLFMWIMRANHALSKTGGFG